MAVRIKRAEILGCPFQKPFSKNESKKPYSPT